MWLSSAISQSRCSLMSTGIQGIHSFFKSPETQTALYDEFFSYFAADLTDRLLRRLELDDAVSAFGIHGMAGSWGILAVPFFASPYCQNTGDGAVIGLFYGGENFGDLFTTQLVGLVAVQAWAFGMVFTWLMVLDMV